mgnify:CR=1 FL=1
MKSIYQNVDAPDISTPPRFTDRPAPPPSRAASLVAAALGLMAVAVGLSLTGMILWAVLLS